MKPQMREMCNQLERYEVLIVKLNINFEINYHLIHCDLCNICF